MAQTIQLVEDNETLRAIYKDQLTRDGYTVLEAGTTQQAADQLEHNAVDLILLDIMLPDKSGLDFLKDLRLNARFLKLPVIMLTSLPDEVAFEKSQALNIHGYLVKDQTTPQQVSERIKLALQETGVTNG